MFQQKLKKKRHALLKKTINSNSYGFTLLELLIAVLIAGLIVSGLLYLVVELLRIDNRETALEEVQRDTQRALNYMADELREAVYVYPTPGDFANPTTTPDTIANSTTGVGAALPTGSRPVLAFWKVNTIPLADMPGDCSTTFTSEEDINACRALKVRRASYDLVVYSLLPGPREPWEGQSRINRYILKQYEDPSTLDVTDGYVDPISLNRNFPGWQKGPAALPSSPNGSAILVDYIGSVGTSGTPVDCQTLIPDSNANDYTASPAGVPEDSSFFACVRTSNVTIQGDEQSSFTNQDVYLFLRGDVSARSASTSPASEESRSPILQTQVLVRGVINKEPAD